MAFPVSQVHNIGSHVGNDTWAWDFRMPEGTPVVAALDGVVRLARGDSDEGGCDPAMARKANYVVIESAGSLETQYLHFSVVSVIPGQHVRRGDLLGYSGKTGCACGAHLHFKVAAPTSAGWNNPSMEARLTGYGDPALEAWVSSPPCTAPLEVATHQPPPAVRQGDPVVQPPGEVNPPALSAAGSAGEAAISVGGRSPSGGASEASRSAPGTAADRGPFGELPLSLTGVPFLPAIPAVSAEGSLAPENASPASQPAERPTTAAPTADAQPRDTEAELLEDAEAAPARR